jgi:flagellar hook-associated protein 2
MGLSVDGLLSGLDTTSIITQLIALERRPIVFKEAEQATLAEKREAWQEMNTKLLALETAAQKLNSSGEFSSFAAAFNENNSSGGSVLSVNAGSSAALGSYDIIVTQLATAEKFATTDTITDSSADLGTSGTIKLTIDGTDYDITVASGDSLSDIKTAINASAAPATATVINAGTSSNADYKLVITGDNTGFANEIVITNGTSLTFNNTQDAQNALMTLDGISVIKDSNTITDLVSDVTISLETTGSGSITFSTDYSGIITKVQGFADAYNEVMNYIKSQFSYNPDLNEKGTLFGNNSLRTIQTQLRTAFTGAVSGIDATDSANLSYLSQVGISTDELGNMAIDESDFTDALKDRFDETRNLFAPSGSGAYTFVTANGATRGGTYNTQISGGVLQLQLDGGDGTWFSMNFSAGYAYGQDDTDLEGLVLEIGTVGADGSGGQVRLAIGASEIISFFSASFTEFSDEGLIFNEGDSIDERDKELEKQIRDLEDRLEVKEESLRAKFVNLEVLLAKLTSESSYLDSQLSTLSKGWK